MPCLVGWSYVGETVSESVESPPYLLEHFPVGYDNTWSETIGTNGVLTPGATLTGTGWSVESGTVGLATSVTVGGTATYTRYLVDIAADATYTISGEFNYISSTLPETWDVVDILNINEVFSGNQNQIRLVNDGNDITIELNGNNSSAATILTTGIHSFIIFVDGATPAASYFQLDEGAQNTFEAETSARGWFDVGCTNLLNADEAISVEWGYVKIEVN